MKIVLLVLTCMLIVAHQDFWDQHVWQTLLGGFLPIGLWYHALYCVAASALLLLFVIFAWPKHLEDAEPETREAIRAESQSGH